MLCHLSHIACELRMFKYRNRNHVVKANSAVVTVRIYFLIE